MKEKVRGYKIDGNQVWEGDLLTIPMVSCYVQNSHPGHIGLAEHTLININVKVFYNEEELQWQVKSLPNQKIYKGEYSVLLENFPIANIQEYEEEDFDEEGYLHDELGEEVCHKDDNTILKVKFA